MRRGFTFIEVAIVVPLTLLMAGVMVQLFLVYGAEYQTAALQADVRTDMRRAAARIYGRAAASGGWTLDPDNRGLRLRDGTPVRWEEGQLRLAGQSLLQRPVRLFLVTVQDKQLVLTLEVEAPNHWRGAPTRQRMVFEGSSR